MSIRRLPALCGLLLSLNATPSVADFAWQVEDPTEFQRILPGAVAGDIFELAPGAWGPLSLRSASGIPDSPLILRAADPTDPPVFTTLDLRGSKHIELDGLRVMPPAETVAIDLTGTTDIELRGLDIAGTGSGIGLDVTDSQQVSIEGATLDGLDTGLRGTEPRHLLLAATQMTGLKGGAVALSGGAWITLDSNSFTAFSTELDPANSPIAPMVRLGIGDAAPSHILIKDTLADSGAGPARPGIMLGDANDARTDIAPMQDVTISGNVVVTAMHQGLYIGPVDGARLDGNAVLQTRQGPARDSDINLSTPDLRISLRSRDIAIFDNWAADPPSGAGLMGWDVRDNHVVQDIYPGRADHYDALFRAPDAQDPLQAFRPKPGSLIDQPGSGPGLLRALLPQDPDKTQLTSAARNAPREYTFLRYDAEAGQIAHLDPQGRIGESFEIDRGSIPLGDAFPLWEVPKPMAAPIFDTRDFTLHLRLRGRDGWRTGGEVLRIHNWIILNVDNGGGLVLHFRSDESPWRKLVIRNARLDDGAWHDVTIAFDTHGSDGQLILRHGDMSEANVPINGQTPEQSFWSLTLGNPFGDRDTWEGEIGRLILSRRITQ